jgi:hypothetical protein
MIITVANKKRLRVGQLDQAQPMGSIDLNRSGVRA